ncbi:hypothetical protein VE03_09898 [Pseudogymnoascus sp. 23342-1-I1]|nr:hypothetical protein VE03_09898 [Pseudogymnoascus sp. 23342-1-I1]
MAEQEALQALGGFGEWIWGDDLETIVFAQAFGNEKTLIFRFVADNTQSQSLTTRIVNCYHDLDTDDLNGLFSNRASMRIAIWSAVATAWTECSGNPDAEDVDVIIDVYEDKSTASSPKIAWKISHEALFNGFIDVLLPPSQLFVKQPMETVDFRSLFVFKGVDFRVFLNFYESGHFQEEVKIFYRSTELVSSMQRHPNIMTPTKTLVTICKPDDDRPFVCGSLYPFIPNGSLASKIEQSNESGGRIPLWRKAQWCYQMAADVAHTHLVAHTYHMDIKPGNFLLDEESNLVLIDWEQSDAPITTAAPEIDGTWDVEAIAGEGTDCSLQYTKNTGPERRNMPMTTPGNNGWNVWNVFLEWGKKCPRALELAEVFSLGRCMWMLLRQSDIDGFDDVTCIEDVVEDWESAEDIPDNWKRAVRDCLHHDPNERTGLRELVDFWDSEKRGINKRDI